MGISCIVQPEDFYAAPFTFSENDNFRLLESHIRLSREDVKVLDPRSSF